MQIVIKEQNRYQFILIKKLRLGPKTRIKPKLEPKAKFKSELYYLTKFPLPFW